MENNWIQCYKNERNDRSRSIYPSKSRLVCPSFKVKELEAARDTNCKKLVEYDGIEEEKGTMEESCP